MAKCFDVKGVEIKPGDVVELVCLVSKQDTRMPASGRLTVKTVEPSNPSPGAVFCSEGCHGSIECFRAHGQWRIVGVTVGEALPGLPQLGTKWRPKDGSGKYVVIEGITDGRVLYKWPHDLRGSRNLDNFYHEFEPLTADVGFHCAEVPTSVEVPHPIAPPTYGIGELDEDAICGGFDPVPTKDTIPDEIWEVAERRTVDPGETYTRFGQEQAARLAGNPKDAIGSAKAPCCTVPSTVSAEDGLAMLEGALKYGRHNYRAAPVRASVYLDALRRHLNRWIEGEDIDAESDLSHLTKARACLGIIRDAQICGTLIDDRPPPAPVAFFAELDEKAKRLVAKYPNPVAPYVANDPRLETGRQ